MTQRYDDRKRSDDRRYEAWRLAWRESAAALNGTSVARVHAVPSLDGIPSCCLTVDVEDWLQGAFDCTLPLTDRFGANTRRILAALDAHQVKGTFFVLGLAAERAPELIREIQHAGHEVQSHGYGHELITRLTPKRFRADIDRANV